MGRHLRLFTVLACVVASTASVAAKNLVRTSATLREDFLAASKEERQRLVHQNGMRQTAIDLRRGYLKTLDTRYRKIVSYAKRRGRLQDQGPSGRCWLFAIDDVIESGMVKRGLEKADLSENFINYHAWRTRSRSLLQTAARAKAPLAINVTTGFNEGGWFAEAAQLIEQHGLVPQSAMPETFDAKASDLLAAQLNGLLAEAQRELGLTRGQPKTAAQKAKIVARFERHIDEALTMALGAPPSTIEHGGVAMTPQEYAIKVAGFRPREYVMLSNLPESSLGWNTGYRMRGREGLAGFPMYNVSAKTMMDAVSRSIDLDEGVWFTALAGSENPYMTADGDKVPSQARNIMHVAAFDYDRVLRIPRPSKRTRLDSRMGWSNHAMTFVGRDYAEDAPSRTLKWKVDNSWLVEQHMYPDFFTQFVDTIVVRKDALPKALLRRLERASVDRTLPLKPYPY